MLVIVGSLVLLDIIWLPFCPGKGFDTVNLHTPKNTPPFLALASLSFWNAPAHRQGWVTCFGGHDGVCWGCCGAQAACKGARISGTRLRKRSSPCGRCVSLPKCSAIMPRRIADRRSNTHSG